MKYEISREGSLSFLIFGAILCFIGMIVMFSNNSTPGGIICLILTIFLIVPIIKMKIEDYKYNKKDKNNG